jgi:uncharacterized membrane protein
MEKHLEKTKNSYYLKIAGILLLIFGIGIPIVLMLESIPISLLNDNGAFVWFYTIPMVIIAFWILPIMGGVFTKKRKNLVFIISNVIALL